MDYSEQLKSPMWQKKRLEILQRDDFKCQNCGSTDRQLQVHHTFYKKDANVWEYSSKSLITVCCQCHEEITNIKAHIKSMIDCNFITYDELYNAYDLICNYKNLSQANKDKITEIFNSDFSDSLKTEQ